MQALIIETDPLPLIVPVTTVAQIVGKTEIGPSNWKCDWVSGSIKWREFNIPLIETGDMLGHKLMNTSDQRFVIFWPMKIAAESDYFAMTCTAAPRVIEINDEMSLSPEFAPKNINYVLGFIKMEDRIGVIPDMELIVKNIFSK